MDFRAPYRDSRIDQDSARDPFLRQDIPRLSPDIPLA